MSAPDTQVQVKRRASDDTYYAECDACRLILATGYTSVATLDLALADLDHENDCAPTQLARLHARWDARDVTLRALVEQWRAEADRLWAHMPDDEYARGKNRAADDLERAMDGDRD